ncbi:helix-turn-helix domain-containing protein [Bradyrhizobium sp. GCM10023182]|uniref:Helix-turn-helix domain-containing protein n=1 Tax=Bradyrhizobium zhengyangense TaxID=2911009 RepID=A0ABS9LG36_9BRAD|nr:helix-turn-helix domain-containing protein [Bradyrhizobium zhengyangense]MCG2637578.1 helix-turn-helix domain-containing protein [Bradyrhizobium zhengyangense]MCG2665976.1 helix-turn-helix domain-containing protein [Bradyrhizobium zhengyangense]
MLVRINTAQRRPIDGHLAAVAGNRALCSEFRYRRGSEIFGEGEDAEYVYQINSGAVRTYKLLPDGRRQINAFHLSGDMFGFENNETHRFTAEAIVETDVRIMTRSNLLGAMPNQGAGPKHLIGFVTQNLQHAENHMLLLGRKTSLEKVAAFLLEMDDRLAHPRVMDLPMTRRDIADYLGLTLETVSRALSILRDDDILRFDGTTQRRLEVLDRTRLSRLDA